VRDQDELRFPGEFAQEGGETVDVGVVERGVDLVEDAEGRRLASGERPLRNLFGQGGSVESLALGPLLQRNEGMQGLYSRKDANGVIMLFRRVLELNPTLYGATYQLAAALDRRKAGRGQTSMGKDASDGGVKQR
jgi:hypothetical protein